MKSFIIGLSLMSIYSFAQTELTVITNSTYQNERIEITCYDQICDFYNVNFINSEGLYLSKIMNKSHLDEMVSTERKRVLKGEKVNWDSDHLIGSTLNSIKVANKRKMEGRRGQALALYASSPLVLAFDLTLNLLPSIALTLNDHVIERFKYNYSKKGWNAYQEIGSAINQNQDIEIVDKKYDLYKELLKKNSRNKSQYDELINIYLGHDFSNCNLIETYYGLTAHLLLLIDGRYIDPPALPEKKTFSVKKYHVGHLLEIYIENGSCN